MEKQDHEAAAECTEPLFFTVSPLKFTIMCLATLGIYEFYWIYKNWRLICKRRGEKFFPFWRVFPLTYFFIYQLFDHIRRAGSSRVGELKAGQLAIAWIVLNLCWKLPDPFWLMSNLNFVALLPVVNYINRLHEQTCSDQPINAKFNPLNYVGIVCGVIFWILVIVGSMFPEG